MKLKHSQSQRILALLQRGRTINPIQALQMFGCLRLSARIYDLKKRGHIILSKPHTTGNGAIVSKYYLKKG